MPTVAQVFSQHMMYQGLKSSFINRVLTEYLKALMDPLMRKMYCDKWKRHAKIGAVVDSVDDTKASRLNWDSGRQCV